GFERDDVLPEPDEHLRSRLPADAPPDIGLSRESRSEMLSPEVEDRVAHEDHAVLVWRGRWKLSIRHRIPLEIGPVIPLILGRPLRSGNAGSQHKTSGYDSFPHRCYHPL